MHSRQQATEDTQPRVKAGRWALRFPGLILSTVLAGCVLTEPTDPFGPGPGSMVRPEPAKAAPRIGPRLPAGDLTLEAAIRLALQNNPDVLAAGWEETASRARVAEVASARWPVLHATGGYNQYLNSQFLIRPTKNGGKMVFTDNVVSGDLVVQVPLFTGGRITNEIRAARLLREAAAHTLARTRQELIFNVTSLFYGILAQRHVIEALQFSEKALAEHLKRVDDLLAVQKAARVDRLRIEVRIADLAQKLVREKNRLAVQNVALSTLLGLEEPKRALPLKGKLTGKITEKAPNLARSVAAAYEHREDYLAARADLEAQARRVDAARAAHWPTLSALGSYGWRWAIDPTEHPPDTDTAEDEGFAGVAIDIPIFEGGRIKARVSEERARLAAARERLRRLELEIRLQVESAVLNVKAEAERVRATQKAVEQAKESLRIEREKYAAAKGSITDVLDAQSALLETQTNYYRALAAYRTAWAELRLAVGTLK